MSELPSSSNCDMEKRISPPKAIVDSSPLLINKNRESLKVKLLVRRSANQLVEQNILPPLKTSPAIHEQRKLLERAKTGDLLKNKIQQRPNREELERRHILEHQEGHIDPSLADKRKMLEKAILVDQLNSKISHRPGPLELIEKNILHANEPIERIVKEGLLVHDGNFLSFEDDSQSSESDQFQNQQARSNQQTTNIPIISEIKEEIHEIKHEQQQQPMFECPPPQNSIILVPATTFTATPIPLATIKIQNIEPPQPAPILNIPKPPPPPKLITYRVKPVIQTQQVINNHQNTLFPIQLEASQTTILPTNSITASAQAKVVQSISSNNQKFAAPGKDKNRKKSKNKIIAKRAIKFHEYKGPSNKSNSSANLSAISEGSGANKKIAESNYELIMQQQCLLEYLEGIYKNPNSMQMKLENDSIKHTSKPLKLDSFTDDKDVAKISNKPHVTIFPSKPTAQTTSILSNHQEIPKDSLAISDVSKLAKMKVSELKTYLKRFNLPVSGPKPLLIERLKPYLPLKHLDDDDASVSSNVVSESNDVYCATLNSVSSNDSEMDNMEAQFNQVSSSSKEDDIVAEQQRKIEELQIKLQQSQMELEKMKQFKTDPMSQSSSSTSVPSLLNSDTQPDDDEKPEITSSILLQQDIEQQKLNLKSITELALAKESNEVVGSLTPLPNSQDLTEIFEILLKNGEWPDMHDVKESEEFIESNENGNKLDNFNNSTQNSFNTTPMIQDESIDKILDNVIPLPENYSNNFNNQVTASFPMDIDDTGLMMSNSDFNSNFSSAIPSFDFNDIKSCDSRLNQYEKDSKDDASEHFMSKNLDDEKTGIVTKSKNGLIGNFDQNLFDTLKNNNINTNLNHLANNDMFLLSNDTMKKDDKHLSNNLNLANNYDLFNTGIPMDFESIIPYNDLQTPDSLFQSSFNSNSLFTDENMMACEDSNLLCNL